MRPVRVIEREHIPHRRPTRATTIRYTPSMVNGGIDPVEAGQPDRRHARHATYGGPVPRLLTIMGSGETAPTMVKAHREVFARLGLDAPSAVVLDTPYGFQENADIVLGQGGARTSARVGRSPASRWRVCAAPTPSSASSSNGRWRASPPRTGCSPGPAARRSRCASGAGTPIPDVLAAEAATGRVRSSFASAAALHARRRSPCPSTRSTRWAPTRTGCDGLDLLVGRPGSRGRGHPALRQRRGRQPRHPLLLPRASGGWRRRAASCRHDAFVLGVDEHTALVIDLDADAATIVGRGGRRRCAAADRQRVLAAGQTVPARRAARAARPIGSTVTAPSVLTRTIPRRRAPQPDGRPWPRLADGSASGRVRRGAAAGDADRAAGRRARARRRHRRLVGRHLPVGRDGPGPRHAAGDDRPPRRGGRGRAARSPPGRRPARRGHAGPAGDGQGTKAATTCRTSCATSWPAAGSRSATPPDGVEWELRSGS